MTVGNMRLMEREKVDVGELGERREQLSAEGQTVVCVPAAELDRQADLFVQAVLAAWGPFRVKGS